jgi:endoglucanase
VCDYSLDVRGGWYDAGDHGKYVVNGGISVYQLMSEFERTKVAASAQADKLGDNTLAIPESGNGVPDVLDEARWELEFLLSMQVPADKPLAGMVHHKIHDENWTGLPLLPSNDPQKRELHAPSTAATLNLAAVAAQAARIFAPYDKAFAARAKAAAVTAYAAALAHPAMFALASDGTGGGSYDDDYVTTSSTGPRPSSTSPPARSSTPTRSSPRRCTAPTCSATRASTGAGPRPRAGWTWR